MLRSYPQDRAEAYFAFADQFHGRDREILRDYARDCARRAGGLGSLEPIDTEPSDRGSDGWKVGAVAELVVAEHGAGAREAAAGAARDLRATYEAALATWRRVEQMIAG